mgnify:CR=1 FL=1
MNTDSIKTIISKYKWNSMFYKYFTKFAIIILIPFIILNTIVYLLFKSNSDMLLKHNIANDYASLLSTIDNSFTVADSMFEQLDNHPAFNYFVFSKTLDFSSPECVETLKNLSSSMSNPIFAQSNIESVTVYSYINNYIFSTQGGCIPLEDFNDKSLVYNIMDIISEYPDFMAIYPDSNRNYINIVRSVSGTLMPVSIFIEKLHVSSIINAQNSNIFDTIYITYDGNIIYCNKDNYDSVDLIKKYSNAKTYEKGLTNFSAFGKPVLKSELTRYFGINLVAAFDVKTYNRMPNETILILILCILLAIVIPVIISFYLSYQYYTSISKIILQLQKDVSYGDSANTDEINYIISNISYMSTKLKDVENDLTDKLVTLKKAQLSILQNQINPHFVFNTLNSINLYLQSFLDEDSPAVVMVSSLSDMMSNLFTINDYTTTLGREVEYTKKYITIELIKHLDRFDVEWDIPHELYSCQTVKMILQPIIENALDYGIYPLLKIRRGFLKISAHPEKKHIVITVHDNGKGFPPDKINELNDNFQKSILPASKHIGLLNINLRIKTLYGEDYGLFVASHPGDTNVYVKIPKIDDMKFNT